MVWYFVSDTHNVATAPIIVVFGLVQGLGFRV